MLYRNKCMQKATVVQFAEEGIFLKYKNLVFLLKYLYNKITE